MGQNNGINSEGKKGLDKFLPALSNFRSNYFCAGGLAYPTAVVGHLTVYAQSGGGCLRNTSARDTDCGRGAIVAAWAESSVVIGNWLACEQRVQASCQLKNGSNR